jgi:hypothetical protein
MCLFDCPLLGCLQFEHPSSVVVDVGERLAVRFRISSCDQSTCLTLPSPNEEQLLPKSCWALSRHNDAYLGCQLSGVAASTRTAVSLGRLASEGLRRKPREPSSNSCRILRRSRLERASRSFLTFYEAVGKGFEALKNWRARTKILDLAVSISKSNCSESRVVRKYGFVRSRTHPRPR